MTTVATPFAALPRRVHLERHIARHTSRGGRPCIGWTETIAELADVDDDYEAMSARLGISRGALDNRIRRIIDMLGMTRHRHWRDQLAAIAYYEAPCPKCGEQERAA